MADNEERKMNNYGNGWSWVAPTRSKLEIAKEQKDVALYNMKLSSEALGRAQKAYLDAQQAEHPCLCQPTQCNTCGGKK